MDRRKATLGVAGIGIIAGAVGLGLLAAPAGAGQAPSLPPTTPQALVQSVLTAKPVALGGTVAVDNNLGLPSIPGLPSQLTGRSSEFRVWSDGTGRGRLSLPSMNSDETYVDDGTTIYEWNSATHTVTEHSTRNGQHSGAAEKPATHAAPDAHQPLDPATAARDLVATVQATSNIAVEGTDTVAGRPAYDLVLTPKPSQRTLLREVKIAVDAQQRFPLQVTVLANNTTGPALQVGFSSLNVGPQDPSLFRFTPPAGATVTNGDKADRNAITTANQAAPKLVGSGWDTVLIAQVPNQATGSSDNGQGNGQSALNLVRRFGTPVSGSWGSGWAFGTSVGNALITNDGRIAVGLVPQQVLVQALAAK